MIDFQKFTLNNGLRVIVHHDKSTPMVAFNLLYNVGARDEQPARTGFAHLFEHLMFEGSVNIPNYDTPLQSVGGENNAFTNNNFTNYYITLPRENLETAFWLESDRMLELALTQEKLNVQKKVVIEEFKQRYLNQPYGDWNLYLRPMVYKKHPYRWPTIGKDTSHIEHATLDEVAAFFYAHYAPNNAILTVAGNVNVDEIKNLANKWFGPIPQRAVPVRGLPVEPTKEKAEVHNLERKVPMHAFFMGFKMVDRLSPDYYATDLISDVLSNGKSARLNQKLVKEQKLFNKIDAYITGDFDPGIFLVNGFLNAGVTLEQGQEAVRKELDLIMQEPVTDYELQKVKNKVEANLQYSEINVLNRAMNLSYFELLRNADMINQEVEKYRKVTKQQVQQVANELFIPERASVLNYLPQNQQTK